MASNLALVMVDRGLMSRPGSVRSTINSIFVSTATTASKMLVSAASAVRVGDGGRWRPMDHVRYLTTLTIWVNVWVLRVFMDLFPSPFAGVPLLERGPSSPSSALVLRGGGGNGAAVSDTAIGRALSHILVMVNEIPVTSRKYEYVLATADRLLNENLQHGSTALVDVNRGVLAAAFSRTADLLRRSINRSESSAGSSTWPSHVLRLLPVGGPPLAACYDGLRRCLDRILPSSATDGWLKPFKPQRHLAITGPPPAAGTGEWLEAEKLAHELLWITNKLRASSAAGEAIVRWAFASSLASLSLTTHPRVQSQLVKITVVLLRELAKGEWEVEREVKFGILALWVPLLCYAANGVTSPVLVGTERWETERAIEDLVSGLPLEDQEVILRNWLEDFAASDSDWPNLQRSFDRWCRSSRKLLL